MLLFIGEQNRRKGVRSEEKGSGLFSGASSGTCRAFEAQVDGAAFDPAVVAEGESALNADAQRFDFRIGLGLVHPRSPLPWQRWIAGSRQPETLVCGLLASADGAPLPVFGLVYKVGSHGIPFDVTHHGQ